LEIRVESQELGEIAICFGAYFAKLEADLDEEDKAYLGQELAPIMQDFQRFIHAALMLEPEQMISLLDFFKETVQTALDQVREVVDLNEKRYNAPNN
jgi:hypothetical protein